MSEYQIGRDMERMEQALKSLSKQVTVLQAQVVDLWSKNIDQQLNQPLEKVDQKEEVITETITQPEQKQPEPEPKELKFKHEHIESKPKLVGRPVMKGSIVEKILQYINDNPKCCLFSILEVFPEMKKNDLSGNLYHLKKAGRIHTLDEKHHCKGSRMAHYQYEVTREVTSESFIDMKEELRKESNDKYQRELAEKTKVLNLNSFDPTGIYNYANVLDIFVKHKDKMYLYDTFIGKEAKDFGVVDKGWKAIDTVLDRLSQEHYVTKHRMSGIIGSKWKLTPRGAEALYNL